MRRAALVPAPPWGRAVPPSRAALEIGWILRAAAGAVGSRAEVEDALAERFDAGFVLLTASGTDALRLALEIAFAARGSRAALLPAYSCYSVATAAVGADASIGLYDLDPRTLSPDLDSLAFAAAGGCAAVVVAHLYGYPADVPPVRRIARDAGAIVIEDAAQEAGGTLQGRRLGTLAPLSVLSFGRGKAVTCGGGGALLVRDDALVDVARATLCRLPPPASGWAELARATGEWALGRPRLYGLPAALPFLGLGETVYRPPEPPRAMSVRAAGLLGRGLAAAQTSITERRERAAALRAALEGARGVSPIRPLPGAEPGELRFPFLTVRSAAWTPPRGLGIMPGYPAPLDALPPVRRALSGRGGATPGARMLARGLLTAPTHRLVGPDDLARTVAWIRGLAGDEAVARLPAPHAYESAREKADVACVESV